MCVNPTFCDGNCSECINDGMMSKIRVEWGVNQESGVEYIDFEDMGLTQEEFEAMDDEQKHRMLYEAMPELVWPVIDCFEIEVGL